MTIDGVRYVAGVTSYGTSQCGTPADIAAARRHAHRLDPRLHRGPRPPRTAPWTAAAPRAARRWIRTAPARPTASAPPPAPDIAEDVDCAGCEMNGVCRADCPDLDLDCCAEDGMCNATCGEALDPDCDPCLENGQCVTGCAVVDPDCCGEDLMCVAECGDTDPDCVACGENGECRAGCPTLDPDCCAADARCEEACGRSRSRLCGRRCRRRPAAATRPTRRRSTRGRRRIGGAAFGKGRVHGGGLHERGGARRCRRSGWCRSRSVFCGGEAAEVFVARDDSALNAQLEDHLEHARVLLVPFEHRLELREEIALGHAGGARRVRRPAGRSAGRAR